MSQAEPSLAAGPTPRSQILRFRSRPWEIAIAYALSGLLWILLSDRVLAWLVTDAGTMAVWSSTKGLLYVGITAVLLFWLVKSSFHVIETAYSSLESAEATLRDEQAFTNTMIESMPGVLYFYDTDGRFLRWNRNFEKVSGYSGEEVAQMHPRDFFQGEERARVEQRIQEVFESGESSIEAQMTTKNGRNVPLYFTGNRVQFRGKTCLVGVGIDTADRQKAAAEREKRIRAESADRVKSAFLANMSHELRTPLNSIIGFTAVILRELPGPINDEQRKQLTMVHASAQHLLALVNDILDISRIEAGQLEVVREPFNVRKSIHHVCEMMKQQAIEKGLEWEVVVDESLDQAVGDSLRTEQILLNLLGNAIKFTDRGGITLRAERLPNAQASPLPAGPAMKISVTDTGIGIREEHLSELFLPFRQIDDGSSRRHQGTGLGLAISQRLAKLMGGEIQASSEWGQGTTMTVLLPLSVPESK